MNFISSFSTSIGISVSIFRDEVTAAEIVHLDNESKLVQTPRVSTICWGSLYKRFLLSPDGGGKGAVRSAEPSELEPPSGLRSSARRRWDKKAASRLLAFPVNVSRMDVITQEPDGVLKLYGSALDWHFPPPSGDNEKALIQRPQSRS